MKLFTFEAYARYLQPSNVAYALRNLVMNERIPFTPLYVVDDLKARLSPRYLIPELDSYGIEFQNSVHMAPDRTTVYFIDEQDALMFILTAAT